MEEIPEEFFITEDYAKYTDEIDGIKQELYVLPSACTDYDLTGQVLWPGAKFLASYLNRNKELVREKEVLEVGAGSGLVGLFISTIASKVILTDGNEIVLRLLQKNKEFGQNVEVCKIDWEDENPCINLEEKELRTKYDIIIGADVIYWANSITPLFKCVDKLLSRDGVFFMCYTLRANNTYKIMLEESAKLGFSSEILFHELNSYILAFKKINKS